MGEALLKDYSEVFPIQTIEDSLLVNGNGDITAGYKIFMPEVFSLSQDDANEINESLEGLLKLLPAGSIFHKQDFFFLNNYQSNDQIENIIHKENIELFQGRPVLRHYSNVYITFVNKITTGKSYMGSLQYARNYPFRQPFKGINKRKEVIRNQIISFENRLKSIKGFNAMRMDNDSLINSLYDYANLSYDFPCENGKEKFLNPLSIDNNGKLKVGEKALSIITLTEEGVQLIPHKTPKTAPGTTYQNGITYTNNIKSKTSMVFPLAGGLPINHVLNTVIEILDNDQILQYLETEKRSLGFLSNFYRPAGVKQNMINAFMETINNHGYQVCRTSVNIMVSDIDVSRLEEKINHVESAFSNMNHSKTYNENFDTGNLFLAHMPGNANASYRGFINTIPQAVCYINKEGMVNTDPHGYLFNDRFGNPVVIDLWNSQKIVNRGKLVIGPSGSGKSFLINNLLNQSLYMGNHVIMIDIGHSYKRNCDINKGRYFDSAEKSSLSFNIFLCEQDKMGNYIYKDTDDDESSDDKINFIYTVLADIWKGMEKVTKVEQAMLKKSIEEFYEYINKSKTFPDLIAYYNFLEKYEKCLDKDEKAIFNIKHFRILLEPFAKADGNYRHLLNAKKNVDILNDKFIVFDLENIQANGEIFSLVSIIIIELVLQKIKQLRGVRKTLIIDEALDFLKDPKMGDFIAYLFRTIRKKEGEVFIAMQNINFLKSCDSMVRDSIIINSATHILLDHSEATSSYKDIKELLSYTDHEIEMLDSVIKAETYREFFMRMGKTASILRMEVSPFAASVYTTKEMEVVEIEKLWKENNNLVTAIYQFEENKKKKLS